MMTTFIPSRRAQPSVISSRVQFTTSLTGQQLRIRLPSHHTHNLPTTPHSRQILTSLLRYPLHHSHTRMSKSLNRRYTITHLRVQQRYLTMHRHLQINRYLHTSNFRSHIHKRHRIRPLLAIGNTIDPNQTMPPGLQ